MSYSILSVSTGCLALSLIVGCAGGGGDGLGTPIRTGEGDGFLVDPHKSGSPEPPQLLEITFGRLVDVHDVDDQNRVSALPVNRDFVINENLLTDGIDYTLETNPLTQGSRLIIHRTEGAEEVGNRGTYKDLLKRAERNLPNILPKGENDAGPFSLIARNACLILRFDDLLDDDESASQFLQEMLRLSTSGPAPRPLEGRVIFDSNHGAEIAGEFHSTRVLIDLTISEVEALDMQQSLGLNPLGLPESDNAIPGANIVLKIPTRQVIGLQSRVLRGLGGAALDISSHGPADFQSPTQDVVRAMRSGNETNINAGFLLDLRAPEIVGTWPSQVVTAEETDNGEVLLALRFSSRCARDTRIGDTIGVGNRLLEVISVSEVDALGQVRDLRVRVLGAAPAPAQALLGGARYQTTYSGDEAVPELCWIVVSPQPSGPERNVVDPDSLFELTFTEAMEPTQLGPLEGFQVLRGPDTGEVKPRAIVVGRVAAAPDLRSFRYTSVTSLDASRPQHRVVLSDYTDLSGNRLIARPDSIPFLVASNAAPTESRGIVMRFEKPDEVGPEGSHDLRGQFFFEQEEGGIRPRAVSFTSANADPSNPVPSIMTPSPSSPITPLSNLGSKLQTVWRYADFGWSVRDETKYNIDVVGLNWAPADGQVISDFFDRLEIRLSHSERLPDEALNPGLLPQYRNSGLTAFRFTDNSLDPQKVVHHKDLGYRINPARIFQTSTGLRLMPWPLNRGSGPLVTYTWRDTTLLDVGGNAGPGVPMAIEVNEPLLLEPGEAGSVAPRREVPSFGLPLLMEFRCFPDSTALAQNSFAVSLATNASSRPNFRVYSTGGTNTSNMIVNVEPEFENRPLGGFNPNSSPPGKRTGSGDNTFYIGQLDYVVRVSRVHTAWFDTRSGDPDYLDPVLEPSLQPEGTEIQIEYRGANSFQLLDEPFDARFLDPYGELDTGVVQFHDESAEWQSSIDAIDGARYLQMRISFTANVETGQIPRITALGIPFERKGGSLKLEPKRLR